MLSTPYKSATPYSISQGFKLGVHPALDMVSNTPLLGMAEALCAPENCQVIMNRTDNTTPGNLKPFKKGYGIWLKGLETGCTHLYWHTKPIFPVSANDIVKRGMIVAFMGNSGYTVSGGVKTPTETALTSKKGTHLHWETYVPEYKIGQPKVFVDITKLIDWNSPPIYTIFDQLKATTVVAMKTSNLIKK